MSSDLGKKSRPVLQIPLTWFEKLLEYVAVSAMVFHFILYAVKWDALPETVPIHFGVSGQPDNVGAKNLLLIFPLLGLVLYLLLTFLSRNPHQYNYPWQVTLANAERQYRLARTMIAALKAEVLLIFSYISWGIVQSTEGNPGELGFWFLPLFLALIFGSIGFYFRQAYLNR